MNAINVISPYKHYGSWVFDDERVGLVQEPFVAGADIMMECLVADIPGAANGFVLIFAGAPFPGHQHRLDWLRTDGDGGNWYRWRRRRTLTPPLRTRLPSGNPKLKLADAIGQRS